LLNTPSYASSCFLFNATAITEIYTLSLHDALPILGAQDAAGLAHLARRVDDLPARQRQVRALRDRLVDAADLPPLCTPSAAAAEDRKSTRLNSSHLVISYAVFCLKKKTRIHSTCNK